MRGQADCLALPASVPSPWSRSRPRPASWWWWWPPQVLGWAVLPCRAEWVTFTLLLRSCSRSTACFRQGFRKPKHSFTAFLLENIVSGFLQKYLVAPTCRAC